MRILSSWRDGGLPLLSKDLLEQSARSRTFVVRITYVFLLCFAALYFLERQFRSLDPLAILGQGQAVLSSLVTLQFIGTYLFLPAMACGVFTTEKENNTLGLLFLTRLGPWTIVLEKFLSRLVPMLFLLLSSLPVYALANTLGGISSFDLFCAVWFLFLAAVQAASLAVMCSAFAHSTTAAFVQIYVVVLFFGIALAAGDSIWLSFQLLFTTVGPFASTSVPLNQDSFSPASILGLLSPRYLIWKTQTFDLTTMSFQQAVIDALTLSIPTAVSVLLCLIIARIALYRRATAKWWNPVLALFRRIDPAFLWLNEKIGRNVKLTHEDQLPNTDPIGWRELTKGVLGQYRYLFRILILLELPVLILATVLRMDITAGFNSQGFPLPLYLVLFLWFISFMVILATSASLFPRERSQQTLGVLLTIPISGRELILQKLSGVGRLEFVCAVPLFTAILVQAWWRQSLLIQKSNLNFAGITDGFIWWEYLLGSVSSVYLFLELMKWMSIWCGLMARTSVRALSSALGLFVISCVIPGAILFQIDRPGSGFSGIDDPVKWDALMCIVCSPVLVVVMNEFGMMRYVSEYPCVLAVCNIIIQGSLLIALRRHILTHADWYLGRGPYRTQAEPTIRLGLSGNGTH